MMKRSFDTDFRLVDLLDLFTNVILYERDVYSRKVFRNELLFGTMVPICEVQQVKNYIKAYTDMIKQHPNSRKIDISYRISIKCHDQIVERFVVHSYKRTSRIFNKRTGRNDFASKFLDKIRQHDAKPVDDCCDKSSRTFSIEFKFQENIQKMQNFNLKPNPDDPVLDFEIIPIVSMNNADEADAKRDAQVVFTFPRFSAEVFDLTVRLFSRKIFGKTVMMNTLLMNDFLQNGLQGLILQVECYMEMPPRRI